MHMHPVEQGSPEWIAARLGMPTASEFDKILTPRKLLDRSAQSAAYMDRLAAEWLMGQSLDDFEGSFWTHRGETLEPQARRYFSAAAGMEARTVGLVTRELRPGLIAGCSPDALVFDGDALDPVGGLELKCPSLPTHIGYWRAGAMPIKYMLQVQGCMYVTGLPRWWFQSYHPDGPELVLEIERDEPVQTALDVALVEFCSGLSELRQRLADAGCEPHGSAYGDGYGDGETHDNFD